MGMTLHYRGCLRNQKDIPVIMAELEDICQSAKWTFRVYDDSSDELKKLPFRGITFQPHPECENVWMLFKEDGSLYFPLGADDEAFSEELPWAFTKTQFAGADVHIAVCRLFKYLSDRWFQIFEVHDEGGYWEDSNAVVLQERMGVINDAITAIEIGLSALPLQDNESAEERIKKILETLRKKRAEEDKDD